MFRWRPDKGRTGGELESGTLPHARVEPAKVRTSTTRAFIPQLIITGLLMDIAHDLQAIAAQEHALVFSRFDAERAWQLGSYLHELARARSLAIAIDVRTFGQPLFFCALGGTTPDNVDWVRRKVRVVEHFRRSSYAIGLRMQQAGTTLADKHGLPVADYAPHGGSFPLTVEGAGVIGSVTVSGLPQRGDHELVVEALCAQLDQDYAGLALAKV